ncbi:helix-turn-helix domain-containing protein [Kitasatospora sp. NBC_00085]|uniref:helix-turn-helix domain-containing protein n=1 Tax=unclassified Kitasatospora TaxID=2633591 RepID=UPI003245FC3C
MALRTQISERQKRFGAELRRLREVAGLAVKDAGATIGMGGPQLSHIEAARTGLDSARLSTLLATYGCTDDTYIATLQEIGASDGKGWWTEFKGQVPGLALDLAEVEDRAVNFYVYDTLYIPGVLQLSDYTEAIYQDAYRDGRWDVATAVQFRMARQRILDDNTHRQFRFIIHEAALRMRFPGDSVMRSQLLHLLEMADRPNITIQVFPFNSPKKVPYSGSFLICAPDCTDLSTIILDGPKRAEHLGEPSDIVAYRQKFQEISEIALPPIDTSKSRREHPSRDSWGLLQHLLYLLQT